MDMSCAAPSTLKEVWQAASPGWDFPRVIPKVPAARIPLLKLLDSEIILNLNGK